MDLLRSAQSLIGATAAEPIDWEAVTDAAVTATTPGDLTLEAADRQAYRGDVQQARQAIRSTTSLSFDVPERLEIQDRHHWIDANVSTFRRLLAPVVDRQPADIPTAARTVNNASMATALALLARRVMGQYDPVLLADGEPHRMYFIHPNIRQTADELDIEFSLFRRWIAFHEVTHAAEFDGAEWLKPHLESHVRRFIEGLVAGHLDRGALRDLQAIMTAIEGYAELVMDRAFDADPAELREKLEERRAAGGPLSFILDRLLGVELKRSQYRRGSQFFAAVADQRDMETASAVWRGPEALPTMDELDHPDQWLTRIDARRR